MQRRRRMAVSAAVCIAAVSVLVRTGATDSSGPAAPQRLLMPPLTTTWTLDNGRTVGVRAGGEGPAELLPDGRIAYHPTAGLYEPYEFAPLPAGRLILTGYAFPRPHIATSTVRMAVLRADGSVQRTRDSSCCLYGATEREAIVKRPAGVLAHDLVSGGERLILPAAAVPTIARTMTDVAAGRLAIVSGGLLVVSAPLGVGAVFDLDTGRRGAPLDLRSPDVRHPMQVRLSPDGRLVAVTHVDEVADEVEVRLAVFHADTGTVVLAQTLIRFDRGGADRVAGMAWVDAKTLRVAVIDTPAALDRVYDIAEVLVVEHVTIG